MEDFQSDRVPNTFEDGAGEAFSFRPLAPIRARFRANYPALRTHHALVERRDENLVTISVNVYHR